MVVGAYANQGLNLVANGKAHGRETKTSNRTWEIRPSGIIGGAFENVAMVEMRSQLAIERAGLVTLHLQLARRSSIPIIDLTTQVKCRWKCVFTCLTMTAYLEAR